MPRATAPILAGCLILATLTTIVPAWSDGLPDAPPAFAPGTGPGDASAAPAAPDGIERRTFIPYDIKSGERIEPMTVAPLHGEAQIASPGGDPSRCGAYLRGAWPAKADHSLHETLEDWAGCAGWQVRWNSEQTYLLQAGHVFSGDFQAAASQLIGAFARAQPPVFGEFFSGNKILVVTTPTELGDQ